MNPLPVHPANPDAILPAAVTEMVMVHDSRCNCWSGRACNCDGKMLLARPIDPPDGWALWYRRDRKQPWELVATAASEAEYDDLVGCGGRRHGGWLVAKAGIDPNADRKPAERLRLRPWRAERPDRLFRTESTTAWPRRERRAS